MKNKFCDNGQLINEASVEAIFLIPLIWDLGYEHKDVSFKESISEIPIGKGSKKILYKPDFVLKADGIPYVVIDAKSPAENINEWTLQCSLYCLEINKLYDYNPVQYYAITNGEKFQLYRWDKKDCIMELCFSDFKDAEEKYEELKHLISKQNVFIDIYDDRMEIYSPGGMYDGSLVQNLDTNHVPSMRRNPIIADIFNRMNYMERRGSGFKKIKDAYHAEINYRPEVEPKFYSDNSSFWVTLYNLNYKVPVEKVAVKNGNVLIESEKVSIRDKKVAIDKNKVVFENKLNTTNFTKKTKSKIFRLFNKYGVESIIGRSDIVQVTGDSLTAAGNLINKMKEAGIIESVIGHGKGKYRFKV